jgi:hypothetical protein
LAYFAPMYVVVTFVGGGYVRERQTSYMILRKSIRIQRDFLLSIWIGVQTVLHYGKYNSLDNYCLFDTHRQLKRQPVQWVLYLCVCKIFK